MTATYTRGEWFAVVDGATVALLDPTVGPDVVDAVWAVVTDGGGVPEVIRVLTRAHGGDFAAIPAFAVVSPQRDGALLAVRGPARVHVRTAAGEVDASGLDVTTWSERWVAEPRAAEVLASADELVPRLPLLSGVVMASRVAVRLDERATGPAEPPMRGVERVPGPATPLGATEVDGPVAVEDVSVSGVPLTSGGVPVVVAEESITEPEPAVAPPLQPALTSPVEAPAVPGESGTTEAPGDAGDRPDPHDGRLEETRAEVPDDGYDHLWGQTVLRSVEEAARRGGPDDDHEDGAPGPDRPTHVSPMPATGRVIAEVPGAEVFTDDHDGQTIFRPRPAVPRPEAAPPVAAPSPSGAPSVLARVCDQGHPNPPQAGECRICGRMLAGDAVRVPRPALGRARLSSGEVLMLDAPAILGRAPKTGRVAGPDVPRAVTVPSPTREVSGTHLAIRLEEWHVLVADLGSSNGTILRRPGQPPQRLHPREPALVFSGDVVDLGDGATVTFEDVP